jgi:hypothetical protein
MDAYAPPASGVAVDSTVRRRARCLAGFCRRGRCARGPFAVAAPSSVSRALRMNTYAAGLLAGAGIVQYIAGTRPSTG